jgi:hypothetical protein
MSDIDTVVVDSLKALDPDGRLEKRTEPSRTCPFRLVPIPDLYVAARASPGLLTYRQQILQRR